MKLDPIMLKVRSERGMSMRIAEACGIERAAVYQWKKVPLERVHQVAEVLGMPVEEVRPDFFKGGSEAIPPKMFHLDAWLTRLNVTDAALAAKLGVARETVNRWKNYPQRLDPKKLASIAIVLGLDVTDLYRNPAGEKARPVALRKGQRVEKITGYAFPGVVRAVFQTGAGHVRCVVECAVPGCQGMLHIFNPEQLRPALIEKSPAEPGQVGRDTGPGEGPVSDQDSTMCGTDPATGMLLYNITEVAGITGFSRMTIYKEMKRGHLTPTKTVPRTLFDDAEVQRWLRARRP